MRRRIDMSEKPETHDQTYDKLNRNFLGFFISNNISLYTKAR